METMLKGSPTLHWNYKHTEAEVREVHKVSDKFVQLFHKLSIQISRIFTINFREVGLLVSIKIRSQKRIQNPPKNVR